MKTRIWKPTIIIVAASAFIVLACTMVSNAISTAAPTAQAPAFTAAAPEVVGGPSDTPSVQASPTNTTAPQVTDTPAASPTAEASATPVSSLKGTVLQTSNCRYGPGPFYLYKIGMLEGAPVEIIGRNIDGGWAYVQFAGTHNLCWINSKLIKTDGDIMSLQDYYPAKAPLPLTKKFPPASIISVSGSGASVTVEWTPVVLPEIAMPGGAGETEYVIEVWSCKNGKPGFYTLGTNETSMTFEVDDSCGMTAHANLVAQNKLGVSGVTDIQLP